MIGRIAVEAIKEWNPLGPEAIVRRANNKAFRKAWRKHRKGKELTPEEERIVAENTVKIVLPDGTEVPRAEPKINARTSTKVAGVNVVAILGALGVTIPFYEQVNAAIVSACESGNAPAAVLGGMALAGVVSTVTARFTKSPAVPGKL